jgi:PPM family protein phosphatase
MHVDGDTLALGRPELHAIVAGATDAGQRRAENQDNYLISDLDPVAGAIVLRPATGAPSGQGTGILPLGERGALLMVADGMGGAAAGRLASGLACSFVLAELQNGWQADPVRDGNRFAECLKDAVEKANRRIHEHARRNPELTGMGTTATVAGALGRQLLIAQVGDSRAYLIRGDTVTALTRDQSLLQHMLDTGAISAEEAERSGHGNVILQALGAEPEVVVDLTRQELEQDDMVLLCSDGLYRVVQPDEIPPLAHTLPTPAALCDALIALANERGAPDNVTVVVARIRDERVASRPDS